MIQYQQIIVGIRPPSAVLERRLVELRVIESGEGSGASLHGGNEALLRDDRVLHIAKLGFPHEVEGDLRFTPHRIKRDVAQEQKCNEMVWTPG